jgi:hypothetical protein
MLIATSFVAAAAALSVVLESAAPIIDPPPPIVVTISAAPRVTPSLVARIVEEASTIFRPAGVTFIWRRAEHTLTTLSVAIGDEVKGARPGELALGWIGFEDGRPDNEIHLSYKNAELYMDDSRVVVGDVGKMPRAEREALLGRALGRALAHELGHYLLGTKVHTPRGLLKAVRSAQDFFSPDPFGFAIEGSQRTLIAARLRGAPVLASR